MSIAINAQSACNNSPAHFNVVTVDLAGNNALSSRLQRFLERCDDFVLGCPLTFVSGCHG
jgi:hypothetical protein